MFCLYFLCVYVEISDVIYFGETNSSLVDKIVVKMLKLYLFALTPFLNFTKYLDKRRD